MNEQYYHLVIQPEELHALLSGDPALLLAAHSIAMNEVAMHLRGRIDIAVVQALPPAQWPAELCLCVADITLYHLCARSASQQVPAVRAQRYQDALQWLRAIASGALHTTLPLAPADPLSGQPYTNPYLAGSNPKQNHH